MSFDKKNEDLVNQILEYNKYKLKDLDEQACMLKVIVGKKHRVRDTLIKF